MGAMPPLFGRLMDSLKQSGSFTIEAKPLAEIRALFGAGRSEMADTADTIASVLKSDGYLADPHTAVAIKVAREQAASATPMVVLSTAHPAKFPDAVKSASGIDPALPAHLADLMQRKERFTVLPNSLEMVQRHVESLARAGKAE